MDPTGSHNFHGISPSFDAQQIYRTVFGASSSPPSSSSSTLKQQPLNILLVQPGDIRHVIKTVAQRLRHSSASSARPLHFYIHERSPEAIARHLLLLSVATDWQLPLRQRASSRCASSRTSLCTRGQLCARGVTLRLPGSVAASPLTPASKLANCFPGLCGTPPRGLL